MKNVMRFHFDNDDVDIFAMVEDKVEHPLDRYEIEDCISSYIESFTDWQYEELVRDVLDSFGYFYEIINPMIFEI